MSTVTTNTPAAGDDLREVAVERIKKRQDFRAHLLVYTLVIALLWTIWALTGAAFPWPLIVMGAWGIGLVMNAYDVYGREPIREEEIQREIDRLRSV
jgi:hypothetical protein